MNPWDDQEIQSAAAADQREQDDAWREQQHEVQRAQWRKLAAAAAGDQLEDPWAEYREAASWDHEMIDEPELEHEAGEVFPRVRVLPPRIFVDHLDHGGRATGYPGAVKRPWIDGPTVAALVMLSAALAPLVALVAWLARRLKVVRR